MQRPLRSLNVTCSGGVVATMRNRTMDTVEDDWVGIELKRRPAAAFAPGDE